jgi:hypothetical protein
MASRGWQNHEQCGAMIISSARGKPMKIHTQEFIGSLLAGSGAIWITHMLATNLSRLHEFALPPAAPVSVCGVGMVIWLHAKWRRATRVV